MTINEKIRFIRLKKGMSQAELAFKTEHSINEIKIIETNGTRISAYILLKILNALEIEIDKFQKI